MREFFFSRCPLWLAGGLLGLVALLHWMQAQAARGQVPGFKMAVLGLTLAPLASALILGLLAEAMGRVALALGFNPWPPLARLSRFYGGVVRELSGLAQPLGRRAARKALLVALVAVLGLGWWLGLRPLQGAAQVREIFLAHREEGQGLRARFDSVGDNLGPFRDLGLANSWSISEPQGFLGGKDKFFNVKWVGLIQVPRAGLYRFGGEVDDGLEVLIDGRVVCRDLKEAPPREVAGRVLLMAGWHALQISYHQYADRAIMKLWWRPPGEGRQPLDQATLRPIRQETPLALVDVIRMERGLVPSPASTYDPFEGGRFWDLPW